MASHETFLHAIKQLELRHSGRLKETEGQREIIRKVSKGWVEYVGVVCLVGGGGVGEQ